MARYTASDKSEALARLRKLCRRGSTVYTVARSVSRSGMSAVVGVYVVQGRELVSITGSVAIALGWTWVRGWEDGVRVNGCGLDRGFHLVHCLSYAIHGHNAHDAKGFKRSGYTLRHLWA